jgi:hypothetical protein
MWIHDLRVETTLPFDSERAYPQCTARQRAAPPEECGGPHAFMTNRVQNACVIRA